MKTFDTNVVLRIVYQDDPVQAALAEKAWHDATESEGAFLPVVVMVELGWVLRVAAKLERATIAAALRNLCNTRGVTVENEISIRRALTRYETSTADFSDCVILESAQDHRSIPVLTFDRQFAKEDQVSLLEPP